VPATHPGLTHGVVHLDYNATTPVDPRVVQAMLPYLSVHFGIPPARTATPSRPHAGSASPRRQVAALIGAQPQEIVFTGSGSEADALAVRGAVLAASRTDPPAHVITQATEHPAHQAPPPSSNSPPPSTATGNQSGTPSTTAYPNARTEATNTQLRLLTRRACGLPHLPTHSW
jgi:hypothetical protein